MAWKPKDKEISPEEALARAKKELIPRWVNSSPLLAGLPTPTGPRLFPLVPEFNETRRLVLLADPTSYGFAEAFSRFTEYLKRYGTLNLSPLIVLRARPMSLLERTATELFFSRAGYIGPICIDLDGWLEQAITPNGLPAIAMIESGSVGVAFNGAMRVRESEAELQTYLRKADFGLPLPLLLPRDPTGIQDVAYLAFDFEASKVPAGLKAAGAWKTTADSRLATEKNCVITFDSASDCIGLIARCKSGTTEPGFIYVEINERAVPEGWRGTDLELDDEGRTLVKVEEARLYQIAQGLPDTKRKVTLRVSIPNQVQVEIFGIRFGKS